MMEAIITIMAFQVKTSTSEDGCHIFHQSCSLVRPPSSSKTPWCLTVETTPVIYFCKKKQTFSIELVVGEYFSFNASSKKNLL